jgi:hypothetical protein
MESQGSIPIRNYLPTDKSYVAKTSLNLWRDMETGAYREYDFFSEYQELVDHLLATRRVIIACSDTDLDHIRGFVIGHVHHEQKLIVIDMINVKIEYRRLGIGKSLLSALGWKRGYSIVAGSWHDEINHWATSRWRSQNRVTYSRMALWSFK